MTQSSDGAAGLPANVTRTGKRIFETNGGSEEEREAARECLASLPEKPRCDFKSVCHVNLARGFRGGERQTILLVRYLYRINPELRQFLVCRRNSEIPAYVWDVPNLTVIEVKNELCGHRILGTRADVIQAHEAKAVHFAAVHHFLYKTPYVITRRVPQSVKNTAFNRYSFGMAAFVVSVSGAIRESVIRSFGASLNLSGRLPVVWDVFCGEPGDPAETARIRAELKGGPVFGHIGALVDVHKGQKVFIGAIRKLVKEYPDAVFIFLGAGADEAEFRQLTADLPQVKWLGFKKNVSDYIDAMDFFVFPSRTEGLGSVLLDVMDHGVPVIASNVGGIPEIVRDRDTGLLFANGDSEDLRRAIGTLLGDPQLARKIAENARASLVKFRPETGAARYAKLYNEITGRTAGNK